MVHMEVMASVVSGGLERRMQCFIRVAKAFQLDGVLLVFCGRTLSKHTEMVQTKRLLTWSTCIWAKKKDTQKCLHGTHYILDGSWKYTNKTRSGCALTFSLLG